MHLCFKLLMISIRIIDTLETMKFCEDIENIHRFIIYIMALVANFKWKMVSLFITTVNAWQHIANVHYKTMLHRNPFSH